MVLSTESVANDFDAKKNFAMLLTIEKQCQNGSQVIKLAGTFNGEKHWQWFQQYQNRYWFWRKQIIANDFDYNKTLLMILTILKVLLMILTR